MKYLDKLLKKLKTDRNTFFTYVFTLLTAYILIDRIVEMLILFFTGMSVSYWGPIKYTFALACPIFAFLFSYPSKFCKSDGNKISFFSTYCICLYVIGISAIVQWINNIAWIGILSLPNYEIMITEFSDLIRNAFTAVSVAIPLVTFYKLILWLNRTVNDPIFPNNFQESICDFQGLDIAAPDGTTGPYSLEIEICKDRTTGKPVKLIESRRFQPMVVIGPSGTGKTSMVMEPMIARDLEKKFFFREVSKEMGYTALKTNIAVLNKPYDNDYLNKNFHLSMLTPVEGKERIYKAYMNKMISKITPDGKIIYKDLGITIVSPDYEHVQRIIDVANNFDITHYIVDPLDKNSVGLNPFIIGNPALCGLVISSIISSLYTPQSQTAELAYMYDLGQQAIQNLVILLKVMYPKMNDGLMPNLQDLLKCFTDFSLVQEMCEEMKKDEELAKEYELQIDYFKKFFYKDSVGYNEMQRYIHFPAAQLDVLLRSGEARSIICNRYNNISFTDVIEEGAVVLLCSRPFEIGGVAEQSFSRFFLTLMMCCIEVPRGTVEKTRNPHFLYVDEFDRYADSSFTDMITIYRKFRIGTIFSIQNLSRLSGGPTSTFSQTLLSNSPTKITFGNNTPEEMSWWMNEFGKRKEWKVGYSYDKSEGEYSEKLGGPSWDWVDHMKLGKIQGLKFKGVIYKIKNKKGKNVVNFGTVDFLESKYKVPHKSKKYNFSKYITAVKSEDDKEEKNKWNPKKVRFQENERGDVDPVQTNTTDSSYFFDNADAISFNLNDNNKTNN